MQSLGLHQNMVPIKCICGVAVKFMAGRQAFSLSFSLPCFVDIQKNLVLMGNHKTVSLNTPGMSGWSLLGLHSMQTQLKTVLELVAIVTVEMIRC